MSEPFVSATYVRDLLDQIIAKDAALATAPEDARRLREDIAESVGCIEPDSIFTSGVGSSPRAAAIRMRNKIVAHIRAAMT